ncbi:MAG: guanylate kinase [Porticoccaceae bacterium]
MILGTLFIISAPSGAGKTSLVAELLDRLDNIQVSISHTTRSSRSGETDGLDYHFVSHQQFKTMVKQQQFVEHAKVHSNYYGTSENWVQNTLNKGVDVILEIDWQGAEQVRKKFPSSKSIFILPPSKQALLERLKGRGQDTDTVIQQRIAAAKEEMSHYNEADYLVINDQFELACKQLQYIVQATRCEINSQGHEKLLIDLLS